MNDFKLQVLYIIDNISHMNNNLIYYISQEKLIEKIDLYYKNLSTYINIQFQLIRCVIYYENDNKAQLARLIDWCQDQLIIFGMELEMNELIDILRKDSRYGRYYSKRLR